MSFDSVTKIHTSKNTSTWTEAFWVDEDGYAMPTPAARDRMTVEQRTALSQAAGGKPGLYRFSDVVPTESPPAAAPAALAAPKAPTLDIAAIYAARQPRGLTP